MAPNLEVSDNVPPDMSKPLGSPLRRSLAVLAALLVVAACGGGGGTSTTAITTAPSDGTSPPATSASFTVQDLVGTWENDTYVFTVVEGAQYSVAAAGAPDTPLMEGFVSAMGTTISLATGTGGECPAQTGNYKASLQGDTLTFTLSNDPCEARATGFSQPFTRTG
jgi:hypothetical protein